MDLIECRFSAQPEGWARRHGGSGTRKAGPGLVIFAVIFAVVLLGMTDSFNLIDSIAAVANSPVFAGGAH